MDEFMNNLYNSKGISQLNNLSPAAIVGGSR